MRWCVARPGRAALAKRGNPASVHGYARPSEPVALRTGGFCGQFHFSGKRCQLNRWMQHPPTR